MVDIATGEVEDKEPVPQDDPNKDPAAVALGRKGGLKRAVAPGQILYRRRSASKSLKTQITNVGASASHILIHTQWDNWRLTELPPN